MNNKYLITLSVEIMHKIPKMCIPFIHSIDVSFEYMTIEITVNGSMNCDDTMHRLQQELTTKQFNMIIFSEV